MRWRCSTATRARGRWRSRLADAGCIAEATSGCATGIALGAPEGLAISRDGSSLYVASAVSNAVAVLARDPSTGALTQATDDSGCIVDAPLTGCTTGVQLGGANAVALSSDDGQAYVASLLSNSVTSFDRSAQTGDLAQKQGTAGCLVFLRAVGCSFGRAMSEPEGVVAAPDGKNVYVAAFATGAIDVLNRNRASGRAGPEAASHRLSRSLAARLLAGAGDGRRQLDRDQSRWPLRLLDRLRQQRGRHLQEERMTAREGSGDGLTRKELIESGAGAAAALLLRPERRSGPGARQRRRAGPATSPG